MIKIGQVSCVADFNNNNKLFKKYIEKQDKENGNGRSFYEILTDAKNKINGVCK
jgi:hypothetical protein